MALGEDGACQKLFVIRSAVEGILLSSPEGPRGVIRVVIRELLEAKMDGRTARLSLGELAAIGSVSQFQRERRFWKATGLTPATCLSRSGSSPEGGEADRERRNTSRCGAGGRFLGSNAQQDHRAIEMAAFEHGTGSEIGADFMPSPGFRKVCNRTDGPHDAQTQVRYAFNLKPPLAEQFAILAT
jgi:hypothetical protein